MEDFIYAYMHTQRHMNETPHMHHYSYEPCLHPFTEIVRRGASPHGTQGRGGAIRHARVWARACDQRSV